MVAKSQAGTSCQSLQMVAETCLKNSFASSDSVPIAVFSLPTYCQRTQKAHVGHHLRYHSLEV